MFNFQNPFQQFPNDANLVLIERNFPNTIHRRVCYSALEASITFEFISKENQVKQADSIVLCNKRKSFVTLYTVPPINNGQKTSCFQFSS